MPKNRVVLATALTIASIVVLPGVAGAAESPSPTATASPTASATPTPTPTPTPSPTATPPQGHAFIVVVKAIDPDPDNEFDEVTFAPGWQFEFEVGGNASIGDREPVTGIGGIASVEVLFEGEATEASITEVLQPGFELVRVSCAHILAKGGEKEILELDVARTDTTARFDVFHGFTQCAFVNAREPVGGAATLTPTATPTLPASSTLGRGGSADGSVLVATLFAILTAVAAVGAVVQNAPRRMGR